MISAELNRRWPPRVRMAEIFPDWAQRVTVFGLTRKMAATSLGVSRSSCWLPSRIVFLPSPRRWGDESSACSGGNRDGRGALRHSSHTGQRRSAPNMTRQLQERLNLPLHDGGGARG